MHRVVLIYTGRSLKSRVETAGCISKRRHIADRRPVSVNMMLATYPCCPNVGGALLLYRIPFSSLVDSDGVNNFLLTSRRYRKYSHDTVAA